MWVKSTEEPLSLFVGSVTERMVTPLTGTEEIQKAEMGTSRGYGVFWTSQTSESSQERSPVEIGVRVASTKSKGRDEETSRGPRSELWDRDILGVEEGNAREEGGASEGHGRTGQPEGSQRKERSWVPSGAEGLEWRVATQSSSTVSLLPPIHFLWMDFFFLLDSPCRDFVTTTMKIANDLEEVKPKLVGAERRVRS